jgi:TatD DNase family protein
MILIDTHAHLYLNEFDADRSEVIKNAVDHNVKKILLPNIDASSLPGLKELAAQFPEVCLPMVGLHPTSVKANYLDELQIVYKELQENQYIAIGEAGIDLYWDTTFFNEQVDALKTQIRWARTFKLPLVIHSRNSMDEIIEVFESEGPQGISCVFHCYSGNLEQAKKLTSWGYYLGIGGVVTYKKSGLDAIVREIPLEYLVLETDAPFLTPVPHRGKRNESAYIPHIAQKIAELKQCSLSNIAEVTTSNALTLFNLTK